MKPKAPHPDRLSGSATVSVHDRHYRHLVPGARAPARSITLKQTGTRSRQAGWPAASRRGGAEDTPTRGGESATPGVLPARAAGRRAASAGAASGGGAPFAGGGGGVARSATVRGSPRAPVTGPSRSARGAEGRRAWPYLARRARAQARRCVSASPRASCRAGEHPRRSAPRARARAAALRLAQRVERRIEATSASSDGRGRVLRSRDALGAGLGPFVARRGTSASPAAKSARASQAR